MVPSDAPVKALDDDAAILEVPADVNRVVRPRVGTIYGAYSGLLALEGVGKREFGLHTHTVDQELKTLVNRHLQATPKPKTGSKAWRLLCEEQRSMAREVGPCQKTPIGQILKGKTGRARTRFLQGVSEVKAHGIKSWHARIACMQKQELHEREKLVGKEDRAIQYRSTAYNSELARYLWQVEHRTFSQTKHNGMRWCAKGLTKNQRAILLLRMASRMKNPRFICADHSRFDAHVNKWLLRLEHKYYRALFKGDRQLAKLLKMQLKNFGRTVGGIRYKCVGKRMSGDINTALGNSVLNKWMLAAWLKASGVKGYILLDGDDSVVVVEAEDVPKLIPIEKFMLQFGMVTEATMVDDIRKAEFCQSRVVLGADGPYFCPDVRKLLDTTRKSAANVPPNQRAPILRASILCELIANANMPMMRPLAEWLQNNPGEIRIPDWLRYRMKTGYGVSESNLSTRAWSPPSDAERFSFAVAWGISPAEQESFEEEVKFHLFPCEGRCRFKEAKPAPTPEVYPDEVMWDDDPAKIFDDDLEDYSWVNATESERGQWINVLTRA